MKPLAIVLLFLTVACSTQAVTTTPKQQVVQDARPISPSDMVVMAWRDVQTIPALIHGYTRYMALHNISVDARPQYCQELDVLMNHLSREQNFSFVQSVNGSNFSLVRINLDNYGITPESWDELIQRGSGPVRISKKIDVGEDYFASSPGKSHKVTKQRQMKDAQGKLLFYDVGKPNEKPAMESYEEIVIEQTASAFLDPVALTALKLATHSEYPIARADWVLANASLAPAYYSLLGIKTIKDFQDLVRFRERDNDIARKGITVDSKKVSLNNRAVLVTPTSLGKHWQTFDYLTSQGNDNLLKDLVKKRRDAGEAFAEMPNGLPAYILVDGNDKILDVADGNIVVDRDTPWRHKLLFAGMVSCTTCHQVGCHDVDEEVRSLTAPPGNLQIPLAEERKAKEVANLFFGRRSIASEIEATKAVYKQSIYEATSGQFVIKSRMVPGFNGQMVKEDYQEFFPPLTPEKSSALLQKLFLDFQQKPLMLADAAAEVGCTSQEFFNVMGALKSPAPEAGIAILLKGRPLRREVWTDGPYQQAATVFYNLRKLKH